MSEIEKLEWVDLKEAFSQETKFTEMLENNIDILNEALGFDLTNAKKEVSAGIFRVDLVADYINEEDEVVKVVIENQFGKTDHKHLGQLLTYITEKKAEIAIWIAENPIDEHVEAINWLNKASGADFYMVKLEAVKIGNSQTAPLFRLIAEPLDKKTSLTAEPSDNKRPISEAALENIKIARGWWERFFENTLHEGYPYSFRNRFYRRDANYLRATTGKRDVRFCFVITKDRWRVELAIGSISNDLEDYFNSLKSNKEEIEKSFGTELEWMGEVKEGVTGKRRICVEEGKGSHRSPENEWDFIQNKMVETMKKFQSALKPHLDEINQD